ncbi:MAG: metallophosphoesterase [Polyangiaceae bacterium]|nr:metallophosphoesterase [Polyangiaceae bacterium]
MRIAHLSDLHLLDLEGAVPFRLFNKRMTGYLNLRFHRKSVHKPFAVEAAARAIRRLNVDHVVITGDVSNLALEREMDRVRRFVEDDLGFSDEQVSLVPGNHDAYTRGAHRSRRFDQTFAKYLKSDIDVAEDGAFPFVKLRGPAAIIGLSTARPRPPFVASGSLGKAQISGLKRALQHPEVTKRTVVLLQHHPWHHKGWLHLFFEGLWDAAAEAKALEHLAHGLLLHGHQHRRIRRTVPTARGHLDAIGVTSASLIHESDERMAGFNVYEIGDDGAIGAITSHRLKGDEVFVEVPIPVG